MRETIKRDLHSQYERSGYRTGTPAGPRCGRPHGRRMQQKLIRMKVVRKAGCGQMGAVDWKSAGQKGARAVSAQRFVVGVSGSAGSLQALRYAAQLARNDAAELAPVLAWKPPGGEMADRSCPSPELRRVWKQAAWDRLWRAVELALGGPPDDVRFSPTVIRGEAGQVLTEYAGPARRRAGHRRRATWVAAPTAGWSRQPVLPGPCVLPDRRGAAVSAGRGTARAARLGGQAPPAPGERGRARSGPVASGRQAPLRRRAG
jgi:hypothetical protein